MTEPFVTLDMVDVNGTPFKLRLPTAFVIGDPKASPPPVGEECPDCGISQGDHSGCSPEATAQLKANPHGAFEKLLEPSATDCGSRTGVCADWPQDQCSYHEGWQEALAPLRAECDQLGLPCDLAVLLRHIRASHDLIKAADESVLRQVASPAMCKHSHIEPTNPLDAYTEEELMEQLERLVRLRDDYLRSRDKADALLEQAAASGGEVPNA